MVYGNRFTIAGLFTGCALLSGTALAQTTATPLSASSRGETRSETPRTAGYDKGFFIRDEYDPFELKLNMALQPRYTHETVDGAPDETRFAMHRARLKLTGKTFSDDLSYFFQAEFGSGEVSLKDCFIDYGIVPGALHARLGQFRRPFSRQFITAVTNLETVDRSMVAEAFGASRDLGLLLHNRFEKSPEFEYALGAFNGTGDGSQVSGEVVVDPATGEGELLSAEASNVPDRIHPLVLARVGYNFRSIKGYSEADLEGGPLRFAVGLGGLLDFDGDGGDDSLARATLDGILKLEGFSLWAAGFVSSEQTGDGFGDRALQSVGFAAEAGYVIAGAVQPVLRFATVAPDGPTNNYDEYLAGLSVYLVEHRLKWQTDVAALTDRTPSQQDLTARIRSQITAVF